MSRKIIDLRRIGATLVRVAHKQSPLSPRRDVTFYATPVRNPPHDERDPRSPNRSPSGRHPVVPAHPVRGLAARAHHRRRREGRVLHVLRSPRPLDGVGCERSLARVCRDDEALDAEARSEAARAMAGLGRRRPPPALCSIERPPSRLESFPCGRCALTGGREDDARSGALWQPAECAGARRKSATAIPRS